MASKKASKKSLKQARSSKRAAASTKSKPKGKLPYVLIRGSAAGVHAGELVSQDDATKSVVLRNARRIWYWNGAASLSELAVHGAKFPSECKFAVPVDRQEIVGDVCEIIYCQPGGERMIRSCPAWRA